MRMVQMACAEIEGLVCVLLPEEQYNLRAPQQLLHAVTAAIRGQDWTTVAWKMDPLSLEAAWEQALQDFHAALDERFGPGQGMAVVLLENFDALAEKLFGAKHMLKTARGAALERRQAEERLRKLMSARGGRFMLVASATGTVDMDYERPLFKAFKPVDIQSWSPETAIEYFNKRRQLDGLPPLDAAEAGRARAIAEFIGGNPRLAQLLGTVLASPSAQTIAQTLDALVDHLADYYRQRMDHLPAAAAGVLDAMIRGGEPVSQTALGQRVGGEQRDIASAFSFLTRSRIVQAARQRGGAAQLYQVRDRLFVHFYRRRYGNSQGLAAIAGLLESFYTADEREQQAMEHLARGEFDDARAFGPLPLRAPTADYGFNVFRDAGISDGPDSPWFALAGLAEADIPAAREQLRTRPSDAHKEWELRARQAATPLQAAAATALSALAAARDDRGRIAQRQLEAAIDAARRSGETDALVVALDAASTFSWCCLSKDAGGEEQGLRYSREVALLASKSQQIEIKTMAALNSSFAAYYEGRFEDALTVSQEGVACLATQSGAQADRQRMSLLYLLMHNQFRLKLIDQALNTCGELQNLARESGSIDRQIDALGMRAGILQQLSRHAERAQASREALTLSIALGDRLREIRFLTNLGWDQRQISELEAAADTAARAENIALKVAPPHWQHAAQAAWLAANLQIDALKQRGNGTYAAQAAQSLQRAVEYAKKAGASETYDAIVDDWVWLGSELAQPEAINALAQALAFNRELDTLERKDWKAPNNWLWAVAKARVWPKALDLAQRYPALLNRAHIVLWGIIANLVAKDWAEVAIADGRAAAYRLASEALPAMHKIWVFQSKSKNGEFSDVPASALTSLASTLTRDCKDPGLLRDLADLFSSTVGSSADDATSQLRAFAGLHEAKDPEQYLQTVDPDLAAAMRRIQGLPAPPDSLAKRGRKQATR